MWTLAENTNGRACAVLIAAMMLGGLPGGAAWAQQEGGIAEARPAQPENAQETETRIYDVSDLLRPTRDYPFDSDVVPPTRLLRAEPGLGGPRGSGRGGHGGMMMGGYGGMGMMGPGGAGMEAGMMMPGGEGGDPFSHSAGDDSQPLSMRGLMTMLMENVEPNSWRKSDPRQPGVITPLGGRLVVTQTPANHQRIAALLEEVRQSVGPTRTVTVSARWVRLSPDQISEIRENEAAAIDELVSRNPDRVAYRGRITCFNGQTVHLASGRGRTVVTDVDAVVATGIAAFDPEVRMVLFGAVLEVTATASPDGGSAVVDVRSIVSEEAEGDGDEPAEPITDNPDVDRLDFTLQHFSTTRKMPLGEPVLIGGMTMAGGGEGDADPLYLVLEVRASE